MAARMLLHGFAVVLLALAAGCADLPPDAAPGAAPGAAPSGLVSRWRTVQGGFIAPVVPTLGTQARPGTGMFVRFQAPGAIALRGQELLVADLGIGRLWRADTGFNTVTPIASAPVGPLTLLLLAADFSAWVLDPVGREVLRYGRDGKVLRTWRLGADAPAPAGMALADSGSTLLVADGSLAQWTELRGAGGLPLAVLPRHADGRRVTGVDAIAIGREHVFVLDRLAGVVHRARRSGEVLETLGGGVLQQPAAIAVDRDERVFVLDGGTRSVVMLRAGREPRVLSAAELGVQQPVGIAVDERFLAVSDRATAQVQIHMLAPEDR